MFIENNLAPQEIKRGSIYYANLDPALGSEQEGYRPVLVIQNDTGNKFSPTVIVAAITTKRKKSIPTHVTVPPEYGLDEGSVVLLEQLRTIDKQRLYKKIAETDADFMESVEEVLKISLGMAKISDRRSYKWSL